MKNLGYYIGTLPTHSQTSRCPKTMTLCKHVNKVAGVDVVAEDGIALVRYHQHLIARGGGEANGPRKFSPSEMPLFFACGAVDDHDLVLMVAAHKDGLRRGVQQHHLRTVEVVPPREHLLEGPGLWMVAEHSVVEE